jgi:hypothetical protein
MGVGVAVGGIGVGVAVGGIGVGMAVGGSGVGVAVSGITVGIDGSGVAAGTSAIGVAAGTPPHPTTTNITNIDPITNPNNFVLLIHLPFLAAMSRAAQRPGTNPPRRICRITLLSKAPNKTKAPLFSSADRHGRVERVVGRCVLVPMGGHCHSAAITSISRHPIHEGCWWSRSGCSECPQVAWAA